LLRRRTPAASAQLTFADLALDPAAREARRGDRPLTLTALEFDLLRHFLTHPRQVFTRTQLLTAVWGSDLSSTSNLVDVYIGYLRAKLGEPKLLHTVRGVGYVLRQA
jgi:two-component system response regulator MprA